MKKIIGIIIAVSIGGVVTYTNTSFYSVSDIPPAQTVGVIVTQTATAKDVKAVLNHLKDRGSEVYIGADRKVSEAVKKELKKHPENKEGFWMSGSNFSADRLKTLIQKSTANDFIIISI